MITYRVLIQELICYEIEVSNPDPTEIHAEALRRHKNGESLLTHVNDAAVLSTKAVQTNLVG